MFLVITIQLITSTPQSSLTELLSYCQSVLGLESHSTFIAPSYTSLVYHVSTM